MIKNIICKECGKPFKASEVVDGKFKSWYRREYCFECKPLYRNKRSCSELSYVKTGSKKCSICLVEKTLDNYFTNGRRKDGTPYYQSYCKVCAYLKQRDYLRNIKQKAVNIKGGKCQVCGYDKCLSAMDFHHRDMTEKEFDISTAKNFAVIEKEIEKCDLLCSNCHRELHFKLSL